MKRTPEAVLRRLERRWWLFYVLNAPRAAPTWFLPLGAVLAAVAAVVGVAR
jgi:hypothetical protein